MTTTDTATPYGTTSYVPIKVIGECYEVWHGSKYDPGLAAPEIAKRIRADIKAAVKAGHLPKAKYSVRSGWATHTRTIDIEVSDFGYLYWNPERIKQDIGLSNPDETIPYRSKAATHVESVLEAIGSAYMKSDSHHQSDYHNTNFYLDVTHHSRPDERDEIENLLKRGINVRERT